MFWSNKSLTEGAKFCLQAYTSSLNPDFIRVMQRQSEFVFFVPSAAKLPYKGLAVIRSTSHGIFTQSQMVSFSVIVPQNVLKRSICLVNAVNLGRLQVPLLIFLFPDGQP